MKKRSRMIIYFLAIALIMACWMMACREPNIVIAYPADGNFTTVRKKQSKNPLHATGIAKVLGNGTETEIINEKFIDILFDVVNAFIVAEAIAEDDTGCTNDDDCDGIENSLDNCPSNSNPDQSDSESDGVGDICDNCPEVNNPGQEDLDADGVGDICDSCPNDPNNDIDDDEVCGDVDNCPEIKNPDQKDKDGDGVGNKCDNCLSDYNPEQANTDGDAMGDVCDPDDDNDRILDKFDNCPSVHNPDQTDSDNDGAGNACDLCPYDSNNDVDDDKVCGDVDNCPEDANPGQEDPDNDGLGDICDNCPGNFNPGQEDSDNDEVGDACDNCSEVNNADQIDSEGLELEVKPGETMALWHLNEGVGNTIIDKSGNMSDGIINGEATWVYGKYGKALNFDGVDDYIRVPDPEGNLDLSGDYTIEFHIKPDEIKAGTIMLKFGGVKVLYIGVDYTESLIIFNYDGSNSCSFTSSTQLQIDSWYHIAVIKNIHYQELSLYINGEIDTQVLCLVANQTTTTDLYLGGIEGSYLKGTLDEIRILNRSLSSEEISADSSDMPDGVGDACDNCRWVLNSTQEDDDEDGLGNVCDPDDDNDGYSDKDEVTCGSNPLDELSLPADNEHDFIPDCIDPDDDNDGYLDDYESTCGSDPLDATSLPPDNDSDGACDTIDPDDDNDEALDESDNCPFVYNLDQTDTDSDGVGNNCDSDDDDDGIPDEDDNCTRTVNDQTDSDGDGIGDVCDLMPDDPVEFSNTKNMTKYSGKETFLISDLIWQDIMSLVPLTTWTEPTTGEIKMYPTLIYHEEEASKFDADSILHFFQRYQPTHLAIVGNTTPHLDIVLQSEPPGGAGLDPDGPATQIHWINIGSFLDYWYSSGVVVYCEADYELALIASTYASGINAPLVVDGQAALDVEGTYLNKNVICVGYPTGTGSAYCDRQYPLEQLQQLYVQLTNTDKIIVVNSDDLDIVLTQSFKPKKSPDYISKLYSKTSLAAPLLASAKQELIISTTETDYQEVDSFIELKIAELFASTGNVQYLTIVAAPAAIQFREGSGDFLKAADPYYYGDFDGVYGPDVGVGRIMGITISDVSSYVARDLFYSEITPYSQRINAKFLASSFVQMIHQADLWDGEFDINNYNSDSKCLRWSSLGGPSFVDIDGDGDFDLFLGGRGGKIYFYRNSGSSTSASWEELGEISDSDGNIIDVGYDSRPTFVDIDNDGDYDMFVGSLVGTITYYENQGNFQGPIWAPAIVNYNDIDVGGFSFPTFVDIDNDLDYDLFIGNKDGTIIHYRNDGIPENPTWIRVSGSYNSIHLGYYSAPNFVDINNDGDFDLFILNTCMGIYYNYYENIGSSTSASWEVPWEISGNPEPEMCQGEPPEAVGYGRCNYRVSLTFVDIDNDSDHDLFISNGSVINYYENIGIPTVTSFVGMAENYELMDKSDMGVFISPALVDIDNDGDYDLYIGNKNGEINYYRNDGTIEFPSWKFESTKSVADNASPAFVDIDNDGDYDLFVGQKWGRIDWYENDGGVWQAKGQIKYKDNNGNLIVLDVGYYSKPVFMDIDNDGDYDLFVGKSNGRIYYYENTGDSKNPEWTEPIVNFQSFYSGYSSRANITFVDINDDGNEDLLIGARNGIRYYKNNGSSWEDLSYLKDLNGNKLSSGLWDCPAFADIDNDGDYDLITGSDRGYPPTGTIKWYKNIGSANSPAWPGIVGDYESIRIQEEYYTSFSGSDWENQDLIVYLDHGNSYWAGINSRNIPLLNESLVLTYACSTCSTIDRYSFCTTSIRKGAIGYVGAVSVAGDGAVVCPMLNEIYYGNNSIGKAFSKGYTMYSGHPCRDVWTLLGDPTFSLNPPHLLPEELPRY